jgi:hypothetical protein
MGDLIVVGTREEVPALHARNDYLGDYANVVGPCCAEQNRKVSPRRTGVSGSNPRGASPEGGALVLAC